MVVLCWKSRDYILEVEFALIPDGGGMCLLMQTAWIVTHPCL
jgi:hypothetical protein